MGKWKIGITIVDGKNVSVSETSVSVPDIHVKSKKNWSKISRIVDMVMMMEDVMADLDEAEDLEQFQISLRKRPPFKSEDELQTETP